jgi:hypothetical protein
VQLPWNHILAKKQGRVPPPHSTTLGATVLFLWSRLKDEIERRLRRAAEIRKTTARHDLAQPLLSSLRTERKTNFLAQ